MRVLLIGNHHSARVGTRSAAEELGDELRRAGVEVVSTSPRRQSVVKAIDMATTAFRRKSDYDVAVVDVYSGRAFRWADLVTWALHRIRKPVVLNLLGGALPDFAQERPAAVRRLLARATVVTAPSEYIKSAMRPYRPDILKLPPHGLHLDRYPFRGRQACSPEIVWVRAFHEIYRPLMAARVIERLSRSGVRTRLTMIGPDKRDGCLERFMAYAEQHDLVDQVRVVGGVPKRDVPRYLADGDVFLNTTSIESLGVSVLEAMACGLCVVSTDAGAMSDLIEDGHDGLLVPVDDDEAMAEAVGKILRSPGLVPTLSENARSKAERFAWDSITPRWLELIGSLADSR